MDTYKKKYNEALERARELVAKWTGKNKDFYTEDYSYIFPELAESEDEKIRKWLVNYFGSIKTVWIHMDITCEQILAWLEKQKEKDDEEKYLDSIKRDWFERGKKEVLTVPELYGLEKQKEQKPADDK